MNQKEYDVIVCGGGVAGIAAALAAARQGAHTLLLEKEYALGGLATLGLIVIYLPLDDGEGVQMSGGIAEELLKLSLQDGPGRIPDPWAAPATTEARRGVRYQVEYNAATFMINAEALLLREGITVFYDARLAAVEAEAGKIKGVTVDAKSGPRRFTARAFVDATGDADLCYFAGEPTVDDDTNRRTGWYYSYDGTKLILHGLTDPLYGDIPEGSRTYSGTNLEDIAQHMFDMRSMIADHAKKLRDNGQTGLYPFMIPAFHGMRMTRRLDAPAALDEEAHEGLWFPDAIGMIGNWKKPHGRYSIPYGSIRGQRHGNLFAAGRCVSARGLGWDLIRVIPSCAVTGQAAGAAAALCAQTGRAPEAEVLQHCLKAGGALLEPGLFPRKERDRCDT